MHKTCLTVCKAWPLQLPRERLCFTRQVMPRRRICAIPTHRIQPTRFKSSVRCSFCMRHLQRQTCWQLSPKCQNSFHRNLRTWHKHMQHWKLQRRFQCIAQLKSARRASPSPSPSILRSWFGGLQSPWCVMNWRWIPYLACPRRESSSLDHRNRPTLFEVMPL